MPPIRTKIPAGWSVIEDQVEQLNNKIRDYDSMDSTGLRKNEILWPIFKLTHQRSRLIYNAYTNNQINKQCYDYAVKMKYVDTLLVAKWKKQGFEYLCCMQCIATGNTNFNTTCICRVPKTSLDTDSSVSNETAKIVQCKNCGCTGCASSDVK